MRWLLFFLVLIYAFNTPGEFIRDWPFYAAPTYEGIHAAAMQAGKILVMLAGLSILMATTPRDSLMTGFFALLTPLKILGLDPDRLAARLWLTLHYVDHAPPIKSVSDFVAAFDNAYKESPREQQLESIQMHIPSTGWKDLIALSILAAIVFLI